MIDKNLKNNLEDFEKLNIQSQKIINNDSNIEIIETLKELIHITHQRAEIIDKVIHYKEFINLHQEIKEYLNSKGKIIFNFDELLLSKTLINQDEALKFLEIEKVLFYKILKENPVNAIILIRKHCEDKAKMLLNSLLDLNSDDSIGITGQRLAKLFLKVRSDIPIENRIQSLNALLNTENDIIKIITTFGDMALTYQSNNDITLSLLTSLEKLIKEKRIDLRDKYSKLMELESKIEERKNELKIIEETIKNTLNKKKNEEEKEEEEEEDNYKEIVD